MKVKDRLGRLTHEMTSHRVFGETRADIHWKASFHPWDFGSLLLPGPDLHDAIRMAIQFHLKWGKGKLGENTGGGMAVSHLSELDTGTSKVEGVA
jgi:hypothetical protein